MHAYTSTGDHACTPQTPLACKVEEKEEEEEDNDNKEEEDNDNKRAPKLLVFYNADFN